MINAGIMTDEEFNETINSGKICICDFSATWCAPCRLLAPILEDLSEKYKNKYYFYQIDIDSADNLAEIYGVSAVPTIIVFKNGNEIGRICGFKEKDELDKFLNETINS